MSHLDERDYSSRDVQRAAGLSARQQNDWDKRGVLPHERAGSDGWRRYTPRELFVLMVCSEIRKQYGTPVDRLKWLQRTMLRKDANDYELAAHLMAELGVGVWLCTDLKRTFEIDSEMGFTRRWKSGDFGDDAERALIFLPVNRLVNKLLSMMKEPIELKPHGLGRVLEEIYDRINQAQSPEEEMVLELIRNKDVESVEVVSPSGQVELIRAKSLVDPKADVARLVSEPYQRLTVVTKDGRTVRIEQELTIKAEQPAQ